ncbi:MAG: class C beta-lactamase-related serine hydrolase [Planctomycetaceae bacterium]|nr:class C beta-lactamase-related serine hydrolase [Planctomycetaceae bacterium]
MKSHHGVAFALGLSLVVVADAFAAAELPRSSPEEQGVSSAALLEFVDSADRDITGMNSFMLVRHGHVVAEGWWSPYSAASRHELYSLSKSFTSTAVGLAIAEGKLSLDDDVLKFFPDDAPAEPDAKLKAMRVRDLLAMSTGHDAERRLAGSDQPWTKTFLAQIVPHKPGTHFMYNTSATYMLSAIVQRQTGMTVADYLRPRLFDPLGIENPTWGTSPQGVTLGGYGLSIRTEDIARFGQLYLQKGKWQDKQLVPAAWVEAATARQTSTGSNPNSDWDQGYGYQFWRSRKGAYRGDGAFGQYCIVLPEQDAVVAITSGVKDMQAVLNLVWDKLLPALGPAALAAKPRDRVNLLSRLSGLKLATVSGEPTSALAAEISGMRFNFPANDQKIEQVGLEGPDDQGQFTLIWRNQQGTEQRTPCGHKTWLKGRLAYGSFPEQPMAACGAWTADDTYTARICFYETPFNLTLTLKFADDRLMLDSESNVSFGPTKRPQLTGTR